MSRRSARSDRNWESEAGPTFPVPGSIRRATLIVVDRWHWAVESIGKPSAATGTSLGSRRRVFPVIGTT